MAPANGRQLEPVCGEAADCSQEELLWGVELPFPLPSGLARAKAHFSWYSGLPCPFSEVAAL